MGWTANSDYQAPADGAKLSYFESGTGTSAKEKRIAKLNNSATTWWLRSPVITYPSLVWYIDLDGYYKVDYGNASHSYGIRPALILPSTLVINKNGVISEKTGNALVKIP